MLTATCTSLRAARSNRQEIMDQLGQGAQIETRTSLRAKRSNLLDFALVYDLGDCFASLAMTVISGLTVFHMTREMHTQS